MSWSLSSPRRAHRLSVSHHCWSHCPAYQKGSGGDVSQNLLLIGWRARIRRCSRTGRRQGPSIRQTQTANEAICVDLQAECSTEGLQCILCMPRWGYPLDSKSIHKGSQGHMLVRLARLKRSIFTPFRQVADISSPAHRHLGKQRAIWVRGNDGRGSDPSGFTLIWKNRLGRFGLDRDWSQRVY